MSEPSGAYEHPERQAVFVGDLVDRGPDQLGTLQTIKRMVDSGSAQLVMGNHEFNAIAYDTPRPGTRCEYLRPHNEKNAGHCAFLEQLDANTRTQFLDWFLALAERCRDFDAPLRYSGLMRDCCRLMNIPLDGYDTFIDDFVEFLGRMPDMMRYGRGTVEADPISLHMSVDDQRMKRITRQIREAAK